MTAYIRATHTISPQDTFPGKGIPEVVKEYQPFLKCILPDFKQYFPPLQLRRMNTIIKSGNVCAIETLKEAGIDKPDCIITATGLGCIEDTEKFLHQVLQTNEGLLAPTAFIQSTHNTIGAQVALNVNCRGYNVLYAHKTSSFENALLDSLLLLKENEAQTILVGGFDEITEENYNLKKSIGIYQCNSSNFKIPDSKATGSIAGEGTTFFLLSNQESSDNYARLESVNILSSCRNMENAIEWHKKVFTRQNISVSDIDLVICGLNGDSNNNSIYMELLNSVYPDSSQAYYKHLCGEFDTASAFGLWFASQVLKNNHIPEHAILRNMKRKIQNIVLYNQDSLKNHCLILLSKV